MNDATRGADNIRNDISALAQRYAVIKRNEECGVNLDICVPELFVILNIILWLLAWHHDEGVHGRV